MSRRFNFLEPLAIFLAIEYYIWVLRFTHRYFWIPILVCILLSHILRRERPAALGFQFANLRDCFRTFGPLVAFLILAGLAGGLVLGSVRPIGFTQAVLSLAAYIPWGIFQQYLLNGYFLNRFDSALSRRSAAALSTVLFSTAHLPNLFLMAVTLAGGYISIKLYRRYHNLYFLGIAHGLFGFLLYLVVPDSISHHLNVGPGH